ncbi:3269_t:CDS:2 [Entrophospora sp. SA101]|nr:3269_t:CDS:2 [Entrophospora sp. SA101]CAJ0927142.1 21115_t:CDS:2 [Entrophospora sp. SA101]
MVLDIGKGLLVGKFVITTLVIGAVVTTTGSASIPIGIGAVIIGQGVVYIADIYDNKPLEFVGEVLSSVGTTITLNGIMGRWKASKQ